MDGVGEPPADHVLDFASIAATFASSLAAAEPMRWGDAGATWLLAFRDDRRVVARRFARSDRRRADAILRFMRSAASAGIPVPSGDSVETEDAYWLVTDHVAGPVGAAWLDGSDRARTLARSMGILWRQLDRIDLAGLGGPGGVEDGSRVGFVHGDFAPINVIVGRGAAVRALLDFEHAHLGDPLEDVAWWGWVVRHHHPAAWQAAWSTFCASADVDGQAQAALRELMLAQLERRRVSASTEIARDRWRALRDEAAAW